MDPATRQQLVPGTRVKVTQQIAGRDYAWPADVKGVVVDFKQSPTGSWFAHSKGDRLWLDRLVLRKDDGEITTLILDDYTRIELEAPTAPAAADSAEKKNEADLPV